MATTTTSTQLPQWLQDYMATAANRGLNIANMPFTAYPAGEFQEPLNATQNAGINMIQQRATTGSPLMQGAQQQLGQTIGGNYLQSNPFFNTVSGIANGGGLQGNPYLKGILDTTQNDVQARMGQLGVGSGSFGNSGVQATAARELSDSANRLQYQNYNDARNQQMQALGLGSGMYDSERGRQMAAMGMAPGFAQEDYRDADRLMQAGNLQYDINQKARDKNYQEFALGREWPFRTQQAFTSSLGLNPGSTTSMQTPDPNKTAMNLGMGVTGLWGLSQLPSAISGVKDLWGGLSSLWG
jgi:hypothetical protein